MQATVHHIQINVSDARISLPFYRELLSFFDYKIVGEGEGYVGMSNGTTDIWVQQTEARFLENKYHRKNTGLNHLCFRVGSKADVDRFCREFLQKKHLATLYSTPKPFPEYAEDYYAVFFEDPDRIKLEVTFFSG